MTLWDMQEEPGDSGNQESLTRGCLLGCWVLTQEACLDGLTMEKTCYIV